jgi:predicted PurR-regulated permease PerM
MGVALFYAIVILLAYLVYRVFAPFLVALGWAGVLVVVSYPVYERLARWVRPGAAALVSTLGVTLILIVPAIVVAILFVRQGLDAARAIQSEFASGRLSWVNDLWLRVREKFPELSSVDLTASLRQHAEQIAQFAASRLGAIVQHVVGFLFALVVTILATFFLYRDGASFIERLRAVLPFEAEHRDRMLRDARELIFASVTSSFVAAALQGLLGGVALAVAGIGTPIFWGVMMAFLSLVPVVGSALIWIPASVDLILEGHVAAGISLAAFCAIVLGLADNVARRLIIGGKSSMNGLVVLISVIGGISVFGMLGAVLGPIIVATTASLLELYAPLGRVGNIAPTEGGNKFGTTLE